jgi:hypothetical protein
MFIRYKENCLELDDNVIFDFTQGWKASGEHSIIHGEG